MSSASATVVPCLYRTGRTIGSGTYAIVKEAVHVKTGEHYACKVINKKLMEGREFLIHNEVQVLKRISIGHKNIVALRDYFETEWNLYLCFDLCTGGELFDRICAKGNYYEADAANIVRSVVSALEYIHAAGIVHRDLKPENLLFRTDAEDAEVMIADFGLSRILDEGKMDKLTEVCGTPAYMAPEVFRKTGHGQPVDIWAVGVITYFLLAGYTPFDRRTTKEEIRAIKAGDYEFKPEKYWRHVSETGKAFVQVCLTMDPRERPEASEVLGHEWLAKQDADNTPQEELDRQLSERHDLLPFVKEGSLLRKASAGTGLSPPSPLSRPATPLSPSDEAERQGIRDNVKECQEQSRKEDTETTVVIRQVTEDDEDGKAGNEDDDGDEEEGREDTNEEEDSEEDKRGRSRRERLRDRGQDVLVGALSKLKIKKRWIRLQRFNAHVHLSR